MSFNKNVPVQLHYQLTNVLREDIQSGEWNIGDLFPTDREIMERYNVSATTVRRAIMQLVSEGWLERKRGKGTFIVKEPLKEELLQLTGFFEEMYNQGLQPSADIHFQGLIDVTEALLKKFSLLGVFQSKQMVLLEKVHKVNEKPLFYVQSFWSPEYGERLLEWNITNRGTYDIAAKELGVYLSKADEIIRAGLASTCEANFLHIKKGYPVLIMDRLVFSGDKPVEFSYNVCPADRYQYRVVRLRSEKVPGNEISTQ